MFAGSVSTRAKVLGGASPRRLGLPTTPDQESEEPSGSRITNQGDGVDLRLRGSTIESSEGSDARTHAKAKTRDPKVSNTLGGMPEM